MPKAHRATSAKQNFQCIRDFEPSNVDDNIACADDVKFKLAGWHRDLSQVTSTLVLAIGRGLNRKAARAIVQRLRLIADAIDSRL